jgi:hypothetical protein
MIRRTIYALGYAAEVVRYELSQAKLAHSAKRAVDAQRAAALAEWRTYKPSEDKTLDFRTDTDGRIYPEHCIHPVLSRS